MNELPRKMEPANYFYNPAHGHGLPHDPFKAIVAPRMIGWISTRSATGALNIAPYSFFGAFSSSPYVIGFSSEGYKDTVRNIEETGEFVWNLCSRQQAQQMNQTAAPVASDIDEFQLAGLVPAPGRNIAVPHVAGSPAALECELLQILRLKDRSGGEIKNWIVFGQVVGVHIRNDCLSQGLFDLRVAQPVLRAGYRGDYAELGPMFEMVRPA